MLLRRLRVPKLRKKLEPSINSEAANRVKSSPDVSWVDLSVIDEVARRLRSLGAWDNQLGDGVALLKQRIETLERFSRFEGFNYRNIKRPLESWGDCRKLLSVICASRWKTFTDIPAPVEACLNVAVALYRWEVDGRECPIDIRGMMQGAVCVEFKGGEFKIFDGVNESA